MGTRSTLRSAQECYPLLTKYFSLQNKMVFFESVVPTCVTYDLSSCMPCSSSTSHQYILNPQHLTHSLLIQTTSNFSYLLFQRRWCYQYTIQLPYSHTPNDFQVTHCLPGGVTQRKTRRCSGISRKSEILRFQLEMFCVTSPQLGFFTWKIGADQHISS